MEKVLLVILLVLGGVFLSQLVITPHEAPLIQIEQVDKYVGQKVRVEITPDFLIKTKTELDYLLLVGGDVFISIFKNFYFYSTREGITCITEERQLLLGEKIEVIGTIKRGNDSFYILSLPRPLLF